MKHASKRQNIDSKSSGYTNIGKAVAIGLLATAVMLLLLSFVLSKKDFPFSLINPLSTVALLIGSLLAGFLAAKSSKEKGMLLGGFCGFIIFVVIFVVSSMFQFEVGAKAVLKLAVCVLSGAIGGIIGVNKRNKRRM